MDTKESLLREIATNLKFQNVLKTIEIRLKVEIAHKTELLSTKDKIEIHNSLVDIIDTLNKLEQ